MIQAGRSVRVHPADVCRHMCSRSLYRDSSGRVHQAFALLPVLLAAINGPSYQVSLSYWSENSKEPFMSYELGRRVIPASIYSLLKWARVLLDLHCSLTDECKS